MLHFEGRFSLSPSGWPVCDPGVAALRPKNERHRERRGFSPSWESKEDSMVNKTQRSTQHRLYLKMSGTEGVNISRNFAKRGAKVAKNSSSGSCSLVVL
jgi:hypothetical protein